MTKTTLLGNLAFWTGIFGGTLGTIGQSLPTGNSTGYLNTASIVLLALSAALNGQGNVQSKTGSAAE